MRRFPGTRGVRSDIPSTAEKTDHMLREGIRAKAGRGPSRNREKYKKKRGKEAIARPLPP
jgi:hypothetical protein